MEEGRSPKRLKVSPHDFFDDASKEVRWSDIERVLASTEADDVEPGWIAGKVFMTFGSKQKSETQIISSENMQLKISITCSEYSLFKFTIGQPIKMSLRGACTTKQKAGTSAPAYMPFSLVFKDGAAAKFLVGGQDMQTGEVVDSWQVQSQSLNNDEVHQNEDWYMSSPIQERVDERPCGLTPVERESTATCSSPSTSLPKTPRRSEENNSLESSITISNGDVHEDEDLSVGLDAQDFAQDAIVLGSKASVVESHSDREATPVADHKIKKRKKRDTRHDHLRKMPAEPKVASRDSSNIPEPTRTAKLSNRAKKKLKQGYDRSTELVPPSPPKRNPALDLVAGVASEGGAYPPLQAIKANNFVHVIGIVGSIETPEITRTGDFKLTTVLVDPSRYQDGAGFKVTCFMKSGYEHILPSSPKGHVLLLRDVRTTLWKEKVNGTVYAEKLKWVAYNPDNGKVYNPKDASNELHDSLEPAFSAFYQARECEIRYLVQLGEWWRAVKEEEERGAIQIADYSNKHMEHRLIGSCDVDIFFNATVEILKLEEVESGQTMLFFSDYTPHPQRSVDGFYGQWAMHASTSKIEQGLLDIMKIGTYWSIKNMRLKIGRTGSLEADLYAANLHEVRNDTNDSVDMHLAELLKRREAYLKEHPPETQGGRRGDLTASLISEISETGHCNVVAELLYRTCVRDAVTDLYVTDYTDNSSLSAFKPEGLKRELNGSPVSVFQISAWDGHELVRDMEAGCVYTFTDVRIAKQYDGAFKGNLKFADKRITRMNVKKSDDPAVFALLKRKREFLEQHRASDSPGGQANACSMKSPGERMNVITISDAIKSRHKDQRKSTIKEMKSTRKCPNKYRVTARIVDFLPLDISNFTVRMCSNCNRRIPDKVNACLMCEDTMKEYVRWIFRFFFLLEDEEGEKILVDAHSEAKYFLLGLEPCDLQEDHDTLWAIKRRLQGCLGNLVEVHEGLKRKELVEAHYGPYFDLAIKSWEIVDGDSGRVIYSLTGCEAVEPPRQRHI